MISCSRGLFSGAVLMAIACGPNAGGLGSADAGQLGSDSGTADGTTGMTTPMPTATVTATTNGDGTGTTGTAESSSGATTAPGSTSTSESSSGDPSADSSSSGASVDPNYPACEGVEQNCPAEYDFCIGFYDLCSHGCDRDPCPDPTSGDAIAICVDPPTGPNLCVLDCSDEATCPEGMNCIDTMFGDRCTWL